MLIVFDGIDGAGKSTHLKLISKWLNNKNIEHLVTREPGGTPLSEKIREVFVSNKMDPIAQLMLISAARYCLTSHLKKANYSLILCDRFIDSTYAYQGNDLDEKTIEQFINFSTQIKPDFTFLFLNQHKEKSINYMDEVGQKNKQGIIKRFKERAKKEPKKYLIMPKKDLYEQNYIIKKKLKELLKQELLRQNIV